MNSKVIKMRKKGFAFFLSLTLFISLVLVLRISAGSVSNISETSGVVNCIVSFDCGTSTDSIRIYYAAHATITTSDNYTYTDPDDCNHGNRLSRKMLIINLTEDTTYYYRLYSTDDVAWCTGVSERSFTTLSRFTTEWKDSFFDEYLVESSSNINIVQQVGTKHGSELIDTNSGASIGGVGYVTMIKDGDTYRLMCHNYTDKDYFHFYTSNDGIVWMHQGRWTVTGEPGGDRRFGGLTNDSENSQWVVTYDIDETDGFIATSSTPDGTYASTKVLEADNNPNSQCYILNAHLDRFGANKWFDIGKFRLPTGDIWRYVGYSWGFDDTDWMSVHTRQDDVGNYELIDGEQCYANGVIIDSGCYIDFNHPFDDTGQGGATNEIRCFLMVSRNGIDFDAVDSTTELIPLGSSGEWDDGMLFAAWQKGIFHEGNYDYIYYNGWDDDHASGTRQSSVSRIRFRCDGLTAYEPSGASAWFRTVTIPSKFVTNFTVNGNFTVSAKLNISVIDASTGNVYSGFGFSDFDTITTNSTSITPTWGGKTLNQILAGDFKLNFSFDGSGSGELFSYTIQEAEAPQFISIDGEGNGTTVYTSTPTFNWTIAENVAMYQLQIANDSAFTELVVNLSDINEYNYPSEYDSNNTRVSFVLPDACSLTKSDIYYCHVRGYR